MLHRIGIEDDEINDSHYGLSTRERLGKRGQVRLNYNSDSSDDEYSDQSSLKITNLKDDIEDDATLTYDHENNGIVTLEPGQTSVGGTSPTVHTAPDYNYNHNYHQFDADDDNQVRVTAFHDDEDSDISGGEYDADGKWNSPDGERDPLSVTDLAKLASTKQAQQHRLDKSKQAVPAQLLSATLDALIGMLEVEETPMGAFARFTPVRNRHTRRSKIPDGKSVAKKEAAFKLTGLCNLLVNSHNLANAYDMSREQYLRLYKQQTGFEYKRGTKRTAGSDHSDAENDEQPRQSTDYGEKVWFFRWLDDEEVHGPFSDYEMAHWKISYFENNVEARKATETEFKSIADIEFDAKI